MVGFGAGTAADIVARLIGQWLTERLGQPFIVENRPGAGSNMGAQSVVRAPADGYTLLVVTTTNAINATLYNKLDFNLVQDIAPVAGLIRVPNVMVINPSVPARTVPEFIAYAKANPDKINMASTGNGTVPHMSGELFKMMAGVNMVHVQYRGAPPALTDLLGGQVQVYFASTTVSIEHIRAGKLRALAVTTAKRSEALPDIPALAISCRATSRASGSASAHPRTHRPKSSTSSTRDQCRPRRSQDQGAGRRHGWHGARGLACRFRQTGRGRDREMGQCGQVLRRQAGLRTVGPHGLSESRAPGRTANRGR